VRSRPLDRNNEPNINNRRSENNKSIDVGSSNKDDSVSPSKPQSNLLNMKRVVDESNTPRESESYVDGVQDDADDDKANQNIEIDNRPKDQEYETALQDDKTALLENSIDETITYDCEDPTSPLT